MKKKVMSFLCLLTLLVLHAYVSYHEDSTFLRPEKGFKLPRENLISKVNIKIEFNRNFSNKTLLIYIISENKVIFNNTSVYEGHWYPFYLYNPAPQSLYLEKYYLGSRSNLGNITSLKRYLGRLSKGWYKLWIFFGKSGWTVLRAMGENNSSNYFWIKVEKYNLTKRLVKQEYSKVGTPKVIIDYVRMPRIVYNGKSFSITIMLKNFEAQGVTVDLQCFSSATGLFYSEKEIYVPPYGEIGRVLITSAKSVGSRTLTFIIRKNGVMLDSLKIVLIVINP